MPVAAEKTAPGDDCGTPHRSVEDLRRRSRARGRQHRSACRARSMRCSARTAPANRRSSRSSTASTRQRPDGSRCYGTELKEHTPEAAKRAGIGMIFQEMSLVPTLTAAQNIFLNNEMKASFGFIDDGGAERRAHELFESLGVDIDPKAEVGALSAGQRQLTEIVKAISRNVRILILDEPTTALSGGEVEKLFTFLRTLKSEGVAIIYVSHRMDEITRIADRATILRDGHHVVTAPMSELTLDKIIEHIVGRRSRGFSDVRRASASRGVPLLEAARTSAARASQKTSISRSTPARSSALRACSAADAARWLGCCSGSIQSERGKSAIKGAPVEIKSPVDAIANGHRARAGGSIAAGARARTFGRVRTPRFQSSTGSPRGLFVSSAKAAKPRIGRSRVCGSRQHRARLPVRTLSGGNQQKVVIGKWLNAEPDIFILDEPTGGVDIGSKAEIITLVRDLAARGKAVLVISSELSELLTAADRILVMTDGRIVSEVLARGFRRSQSRRRRRRATSIRRAQTVLHHPEGARPCLTLLSSPARLRRSSRTGASTFPISASC